VKLLANENFPLLSVLFLRGLGYDIISIGEEYPGISDEYVMDLAATEQRVILTFDKDYGELIYKYNYKPEKGVIYLRLEKYEPDEPGAIVHRLFHEYKIETERTLTVFDGLMIRQRKY
jgi:predicted nuclease of predicted toxin-antitoxin system